MPRPSGSRPVHPRVYGELSEKLRGPFTLPGSSPRVRGTRRQQGLIRFPQRFIPACTGNSITSGSSSSRIAVHPRVYGELRAATWRRLQDNGSSPRVRGTRISEEDIADRLRFIPACTGNSSSAMWPTPPTTVHPRVYGELDNRKTDRIKIRGSSPRVRGTLRPSSIRRGPRRFIPACTGNSRSPRPRQAAGSVHPRVYGELSTEARVGASTSGSSPRVRGTQIVRRLPIAHQRFIPACTGNSPQHSSRSQRLPVHPRVYGELPKASR